jgi:CBS domain-containing protein
MMKTTAQDVMTTRFHTLKPGISIAEAVTQFKKASQEEQQKVFGMMVTDEKGRLIGMLSMYDILLLIRPKHIQVWGMMEDVDVSGLVDISCQKAKSILVGDVMTAEVLTITPDTHLLVILDIMIKKHIRRIPVVEGDKIKGIVYISNLFYHLLDRLIA